jgi:hypothetical protein
MTFASFRNTARRHGTGRAGLRTLVGLGRRVVDFEICRLECNSGAPYAWPDVVGYETRMVGSAEFHRALCPELARVDYRWAFARGDACAASFNGAELVGYTFYSTLPTRARPGVDFVYPSSYVYSYASATAPSHRGHRLEQDRWKAARRHRNAAGADPRLIWYVNVANLESRATARSVGEASVLLGYLAYFSRGKGFTFLASRGARSVGASFRAAAAP